MLERQYIPYGPHGDKHPTKGTVLDILREIRGIIHKRKRIPPQNIINIVLSKGAWDSGMSGGCKWVPFTIDENEYSELIQIGRKTQWEIVEYPSWIETVEHFSIWQYDVDFDIPWQEHKRLSDIGAITKEALDQAIDQNQSEEVISKLHLENYHAQQEVADYFNFHIEKFHNR